MVVRELISKLGFEVDESGAHKADGIFGHLKGSALVLAGLFTGIGVGLFELAESSAKFGVNILETSQRVGLGVESFQKLSFAASQYGVDQEQFSTGLGILATKLEAVRKGGKGAGEAFQQLGINPSKFKNTEEAILTIADQFSKLQDPTGFRKVALARELFGRSGARLIPLLNQGSDALRKQGAELEKLGALFSEHDVEVAHKFEIQMHNVKTALLAIKNRIGIELLPIFSAFLVRLQEWLKVNHELLKTKLEQFVKGLIGVFKEVYQGAKFVVEVLSDLVSSVGGAENAVRLLTIAFGIFAAAEVIEGIIAIGEAIWGLVEALIAGEGAAALMDLAVAAIPLLIAALAAAVYLIVDDIQAFLDGQPSLFGPYYEKAMPYVEKLKELWEKVKGFFLDAALVIQTDVLPMIVSFWNTFISPIFTLIGWIGKLIGWLWKVLDPISAIIKLLEYSPLGVFFKGLSAIGKIPSLITSRASEIRAEQADNAAFSDKVKENTKNPLDLLPSPQTGLLSPDIMQGLNAGMANVATSPAFSPGLAAAGTPTQNNDVKIDQKFDISINGSADPEGIAQQILTTAQEKRDDEYRAAHRALQAASH